MIDITLTARSAQAKPEGYHNVTVYLEDVEKSDILDNFKIEDILNHFDDDELLEAIGKEKAVAYFEIIEQ